MNRSGKKCPIKSHKKLTKMLNNSSRKSSIQDIIQLSHEIPDIYESVHEDMFKIHEKPNESTGESPSPEKINYISDQLSNEDTDNNNFV